VRTCRSEERVPQGRLNVQPGRWLKKYPRMSVRDVSPGLLTAGPAIVGPHTNSERLGYRWRMNPACPGLLWERRWWSAKLVQ
jgi:hypothetical protein